jgi:hypothetical protein
MIHKPIEISRVSGRISLQKRVRSWLLTKAAVLRWLEASTTQSTAAAQDAALARAPAAQRVTAWGKGHGHFLLMRFRVAPYATAKI